MVIDDMSAIEVNHESQKASRKANQYCLD